MNKSSSAVSHSSSKLVYPTRLHPYDTDTDTDTDIRDARASLTDILARKIALVGQVGGQVGDDPCEDDVFGVRVGPVKFPLKHTAALHGYFASVGGMRSIGMSMSVCLYVCLSVRSHNSKTTRPDFTCACCLWSYSLVLV